MTHITPGSFELGFFCCCSFVFWVSCCIVIVVFLGRVLLCSPGWPETREPPTLASQVLAFPPNSRHVPGFMTVCVRGRNRDRDCIWTLYYKTIFLRFYFLNFMCLEFFAYIYVCSPNEWHGLGRQKRMPDPQELGLQAGCEPACGFQEPKLVPLESSQCL